MRIFIRIRHDGKCVKYNSKDQFVDYITDLTYVMKLDETRHHLRCYEYCVELGFTGIEKIQGQQNFEFALPNSK